MIRVALHRGRVVVDRAIVEASVAIHRHHQSGMHERSAPERELVRGKLKELNDTGFVTGVDQLNATAERARFLAR